MTGDIDRDLGRVEGKLDALIMSVREMGEQSASGRARLYERVEKIAADTTDVDRRLKTVEGTIETMAPMVNDFDKLRQRGLGMLAAIGFVWLLVGGLMMQGLGWVWGQIVRALTGH